MEYRSGISPATSEPVIETARNGSRKKVTTLYYQMDAFKPVVESLIEDIKEKRIFDFLYSSDTSDNVNQKYRGMTRGTTYVIGIHAGTTPCINIVCDENADPSAFIERIIYKRNGLFKKNVV